ncbi:uncharacterized protein BYT42DRAFT_277702 [Radiomyces spectabilis]|uniref:uncharacterized protein n=1 Tax=Radiomyces spectabilis TaxID=64574 RepID=UPI00221E6084|nr:uncharacterized protein BYT42DRAFT_277702 [Radiomyces spectabilis]KAI8384871.1 hypothetical protein BYT42DRAFT_277702 [Radiomyces spectabilis]
MKITDMLNPITLTEAPLSFQQLSPPQSPQPEKYSGTPTAIQHLGKSRSRFSDLEDAIICEGVAKGLTWGQISGQLPHRKRATCFNRYRTLQGIRKSRKSHCTTRSPSSIPTSPEAWLSSPPPPSAPLSHHSQSTYSCSSAESSDEEYWTTSKQRSLPPPDQLYPPFDEILYNRYH